MKSHFAPRHQTHFLSLEFCCLSAMGGIPWPRNSVPPCHTTQVARPPTPPSATHPQPQTNITAESHRRISSPLSHNPPPKMSQQQHQRRGAAASTSRCQRLQGLGLQQGTHPRSPAQGHSPAQSASRRLPPVSSSSSLAQPTNRAPSRFSAQDPPCSVLVLVGTARQ